MDEEEKSMKRLEIIGWIMAVVCAVFMVIVLSGCSSTEWIELKSTDDVPYKNSNSFTVASWNLQVFGTSKMGDFETMAFYDEKMSQYDIVFVQEIRDKSGLAFKSLCSRLNEYECMVVERDGRSSSKEQIGLMYRDHIQVVSFERISDPGDVWERAPARAEFVVGNYTFIAFNAHLKPDDVDAEIDALYKYITVIEDEGNIVVLGDLNADCSYYNSEKDSSFDNWFWGISDSIDTTVGKTDCAYDRIIVNEDMRKDILRFAVDKEGILLEHSDHYLVWMEVVI